MASEHNIPPAIGQLQGLSPTGFALAFHIDFTTPTFLFQTYPKEWISHYSEKGLVMSDPTVHWGFENEGTCRWSDLSAQDSAGVLGQAAEHGMTYGVTCAVACNDDRSFASFSRGDREFDDAERDELLETVKQLHRATKGEQSLPSETVSTLKEMGVEVSYPAKR